LDFRNQLHILKIIQRLAKEKNIACIMNTHYRIMPSVLRIAASPQWFANHFRENGAGVIQRKYMANFFCGFNDSKHKVSRKEIKTFVLLDDG
jgi:hypothetical protein